jgi:dihydroorotate dehydrogenase
MVRYINHYQRLGLVLQRSEGSQVFQALWQANINIKFRENRNTWHKPMFVKIATDLTKTQLDDILSVVEKFQIAGIVATNTTTSRV